MNADIETVVDECLPDARQISRGDLVEAAWLTDDELRQILRLAAERMKIACARKTMQSHGQGVTG